MEMNSSPVSPGYWPSQWRPPANPYTENGGGGRGLEWKREKRGEEGGPVSEKWASVSRHAPKGRGWSWRKGMYDWCWYRGLNNGAHPGADPVVVRRSLPASWHWNKGCDTWAVIEAILLFGKRRANVTQLIWITGGCYCELLLRARMVSVTEEFPPDMCNMQQMFCF